MHLLDISPPLSVLAHYGDKEYRGAPAEHLDGHSFLVHSTFSFTSDRTHGIKENQNVPAVLRYLLSSIERLQRLEVTYTRGNRGSYTFPSWFADRGSGLGVSARFASSADSGETEDLDTMANVIARVIGCSASSILNRKTFGRYRVLDGDDEVMLGYSTQDFPCVESIAQWMKLLPCGGQRGLSGFMKSLRLLELPYHSLRMIIDSRKGIHIEVSAIVHKNQPPTFFPNMKEPLLRSRKPRPSRKADVRPVQELLTYFQSVEQTLQGCQTVEESEVSLSSSTPKESPRRFVAFGDHQHLEHSLDASKEQEANSVLEPVYHVDVSNGIEKRKEEPRNIVLGTLATHIRVEKIQSPQDSATAAHTHRAFMRQLIPWEVACSNSTLVIRDIRENDIATHAMFWLPSKPREHASVLEVSFDMPPMIDDVSTVSVKIDVERTVLSVFDYPPDTSRGIDIPAPLVCIGSKNTKETTLTGLLSHEEGCDMLVAGQNTLFQLPIPDASMPFNVACFTATVLSLIFGSVMSMILWDKAQLKKFQASKASLRSRVKRMAFVLIFGGTALVYLDPTYQAYVESYIDTFKMSLSL